MVAGDFNVTLCRQDRSNVNYPTHNMMKFRAVVDELQLQDLRLQGQKYTWSRAETHARLDRFLVNSAWVGSYPNSTQMAIASQLSDHIPVLCSTQTKFPSPNVFRMETQWLKEESFKRKVLQNWDTSQLAQNPEQLDRKLKLLIKEIIRWKKDYKQRINRQRKLCTDCLQWMNRKAEDRKLNGIEQLLKEILAQRYQQLVLEEEQRWQQRAKQ